MIALGVIELREVDWKWRRLKVSSATAWLICWSAGSLVLMSLLPSKRVDRIFPVIPVLCLLLGAQVTVLASRVPFRPLIRRLATVAIAIAIAASAGYFGWKAATGYHEHRAALADFGADVRSQAAANKWRYAVVSAPDESLLLYLRKTEFLLPLRAADEWNAAQIDAVVVSTRDQAELMGRLTGAATTVLRSTHREDGDSLDYILLARSDRSD